MKPWREAASVGVAVFVTSIISFACGYWLQPLPEREKIVTVDREVSAHVSAWVGTSATKTATRERWRERVVYRPGGVVEVTKETIRDAESETKTAASGTTAAVKETQHETVRTVERTTRPAWLVTAAAGADLDRRLLVGGGLARRLVGPLYVGAQVVRADSRWSGLLTLTATF